MAPLLEAYIEYPENTPSQTEAEPRYIKLHESLVQLILFVDVVDGTAPLTHRYGLLTDHELNDSAGELPPASGICIDDECRRI